MKNRALRLIALLFIFAGMAVFAPAQANAVILWGIPATAATAETIMFAIWLLGLGTFWYVGCYVLLLSNDDVPLWFGDAIIIDRDAG